uniref:Uncharacterized protein n=1 Tax=Laticauda laticaudata TaxID=8630 RepID=A0A8C5S2U1_LATLA
MRLCHIVWLVWGGGPLSVHYACTARFICPTSNAKASLQTFINTYYSNNNEIQVTPKCL